MVALLGVSKAVLDNVIFCHQEDSNWCAIFSAELIDIFAVSYVVIFSEYDIIFALYDVCFIHGLLCIVYV